jgi:hypothetical protein
MVLKHASEDAAMGDAPVRTRVNLGAEFYAVAEWCVGGEGTKMRTKKKKKKKKKKKEAFTHPFFI